MHEAELLELLETRTGPFHDTVHNSEASSAATSKATRRSGLSYGQRGASNIVEWVCFRRKLLELFAIKLCGYIAIRSQLFRRAIRDGYKVDRKFEEGYLQRLVEHHRSKPLTSRKLREYPHYLKRLLKVVGGRKTGKHYGTIVPMS